MEAMEARLKVMEALQEEAYKGIVRIDSQTMRQIDVKPGSIVEIEGGRATVGIVDRAYPTDIGQAVIRMDGILRRNAKTGIGEVVKVRKCDVKEAKSVVIAPAQKGVMVQADPDVFKRGLLGRAVVKGDIVALGGARSRRRTMAGSPFEDIFDVFEQGFMGNFGFGGLKFIVVDANPKQSVIITESTEVKVNPKAVEVTEELAPDVTYEDIGGLSEEIKKIREMVELPLKHPELFERLGIEPPKGVLLHGSPGTGKTLLAKAVANESDANFLLINGPEVTSKFYGECLVGDTKVYTNPNGPKPIKEINKAEKVFVFDENTKEFKKSLVKSKIFSGYKKVYKINAEGKEIEASANHPFLKLNKNVLVWIPLEDLKIGDFVCVAENTPENNFKNTLPKLNFARIDRIDFVGTKPTYDIEVDNYHNFIANGFIVHNSEKRIREIFEEAEKNAPSIIFIDEIDAIAPKREETYGEVERRMVAQLLATMDGLKSRGKVVVIGATNRPNSLDPALRRPGRFDREIEIGVPSKAGRLNILKIHTRNMPLMKDVDLDKIAGITHGFVGADLAALCKEAAMNVLRKVLSEFDIKENTPLPPEVLDKLRVYGNDFKEALKLVRPSAMREVLVEVPNVKWKDIGGLDKLKQELKEAVEWPLKYPHAFSKLGIKPPKGILMYGPPGTGKTLLAKAVANESESNFISIKGPELISKWVGDSLPYDEKLIVKKNCSIKFMKIGDIVENKENVQVLAFDKDKRIRFTNISDYIKHPLRGKLLELTTRTGRKIKVTDYHSVFSFINGKFTEIPVSHLIEKESYIAIPKNLNLPRETLKSINLYENFKEDEEIFVANVKEYLIKSKLILGLDKTAEILDTSKNYLTSIISLNLPVSITKFDKLIKEAKLALDFNEIKIKLKGSIHNYNSILEINKDFWRLVGLWVAEGDFNGYTVRLHNQNEEIRNDMHAICENLNFNISKSKKAFSINSLLLQKLFRNVLGLKTGAHEKDIPDLLFSLDKESKANFLKGYFSGDGSNWPKEKGKFNIEAGTVSNNLANSLLYLLLDFGIVATRYNKKEKTGSITKKISILGVKNFEKFKEIGFIDKKRNDRIDQYIKSRKWFRSDLIPLTGELFNLVTKNHSSYNSNILSIGKENLKQILVYVDKDKSKYKEYWDLTEGDLFFDMIKEIKELPNENYVYDISVPGEENFVAGFGGILAHNSEKGIKKIFEKARQAAPTIIFFDEIDAIAGKRGLDPGTKVTERMVNQLLTEMDGLEELTDVVVIGASVTGDTKIMIKDKNKTKILPIKDFIDPYYKKDEEGIEKLVENIKTLGFEALDTKPQYGLRFNNSAFKKVRGVFRHKVDKIYELEYIGGKIRTTGNHSVFIRTRHGIVAKPVATLKTGDILVDLPFKVRTNEKFSSIRYHKFNNEIDLKLPIYVQDEKLINDYNLVMSEDNLSQEKLAELTGNAQTTISAWKRGICGPRELSLEYFKHKLPNEVAVTPELMRLLGYYTAEGYARKEIDFCFNINETEYHADVQNLMNDIFSLEKPDKIKYITNNAVNIVYYSKPLADFFIRCCGKGAYNKHIPGLLFEAPKEYFLEFLKSYTFGDGHFYKDGKIEATSVSKQLIVELNWLCRMHGIKSYISKFIAKAGRKINGKIIEKDSLAFRLGISKHNNPFINKENNKSYAKRAKIKSIKILPYNDYVYDLCGCDNEAFFGGESPILLHNTNRPDLLDTALLRPGRFDRIISSTVPDKESRLEIFRIHTKNMPLSKDVDINKLTEKTEGYVGADIEGVCREAGLLTLRDNIKAAEVSMKYFQLALEKVKPSIRSDDLKKYQEIEEDYLRTARAAIEKPPSYLG